MKKCYYLLLVISCCFSWSIGRAQISEGGTPPSFAYENTTLTLRSASKLHIPFSVDDLLAEDVVREAAGGLPRIAKIIPVNFSINNSGEWTELPNGQHIWRLTIDAPGATGIILTYDEFVIPPGGKLFIYNQDRSRVLGAYAEKTNRKGEEFATELVPGDKITLEYVASPFVDLENSPAKTMSYNTGMPTATAQQPRIVVAGVGYAYGDEFRARGKSESCEVNVNCAEGADWQDEKKGVARYTIPIRGAHYLCTGSVVNNTAEDFRPLFLSAHHCVNGATTAELKEIVFYFHYEYPDCANLGTDPEVPTMTGATLLSKTPMSGGSDGALLELNDRIPSDYDVYYNGWDRTDVPAQSGVGIHHPAGDVKKISTFTSNATFTTWNGEGMIGATNAHWNVTFVATANGHGVTEGGSSGSPLFDQNGLVVGTLSGGNSACSTTAAKNGRNLYGSLWYHWDGSPSTAEHFNTFLDPNGTGKTTMQGTYQIGRVLNLAGTYDRAEAKTTITWEPPLETEVDRYIVYIDGVEDGSTTELQYVHEGPEIGFTEYCVAVKDAVGDLSSRVCVTVCNPFAQTITWEQSLTGIGYTTEPVLLTASVAEGLPITYVSSNEAVAQIDSNKLIIKALGEAVITASQAGNINYLPAENVTKTLTVVNGAITVNSIAIDNGADLTIDASVAIDFSFSGGFPTDYKVSEQADLTDASWQSFSDDMTYAFASPKNGVKTLYAQLKNSTGEANIVSGQIIFKALHEKLSVRNFVLNSGEMRTTERVVTLNHRVENDWPTHYSVAEDASLVGIHWNPYVAAPTYQLSERNGFKDVYFMVANTADTSDVVRTGIYLDEAETLQSQGLTAKLYPNPVKESLNVQVEENISSVNVTVYSVVGEVYLSKVFHGSSFTIDVSKCPSGILLVKLTNGDSYTVKRIIKQ